MVNGDGKALNGYGKPVKDEEEALNCTKFSPSLDFEIELLTLKMAFDHQNSFRNRLLRKTSHQKDILHFFLFCFLKIIFLHFIPSK